MKGTMGMGDLVLEIPSLVSMIKSLLYFLLSLPSLYEFPFKPHNLLHVVGGKKSIKVFGFYLASAMDDDWL